MAKKLVAYFSASGTTKKTAEMIAEAGDFDLWMMNGLLKLRARPEF